MSPTVPPISVMTTSVSDASRHPPDPLLDLVRDVRDHLDGRAQVLALALLADDRVPDRARGVVCVAREVLVDEALVVADVEVGLGPVLRDEHLAVLEGAHRPWVDVQVRVELLHLDAQAARLQEAAERRRGDALAERRDDPTRDEDVLRRPRLSPQPPERVELAQHRRPLDQRAERPPLAEEVEACQRRQAPSERARPWSRPTEFKPSTAPSAFDPASPSIALSRRS